MRVPWSTRSSALLQLAAVPIAAALLTPLMGCTALDRVEQRVLDRGLAIEIRDSATSSIGDYAFGARPETDRPIDRVTLADDSITLWVRERPSRELAGVLVYATREVLRENGRTEFRSLVMRHYRGRRIYGGYPLPPLAGVGDAYRPTTSTSIVVPEGWGGDDSVVGARAAPALTYREMGRVVGSGSEDLVVEVFTNHDTLLSARLEPTSEDEGHLLRVPADVAYREIDWEGSRVWSRVVRYVMPGQADESDWALVVESVIEDRDGTAVRILVGLQRPPSGVENHEDDTKLILGVLRMFQLHIGTGGDVDQAPED